MSVLGAVFSILLGLAQQTLRLDLSGIPAQQATLMPAVFQAQLPVSLRITDLVDQTNSPNTPITIDVEVENVSENPIVLPWSGTPSSNGGSAREIIGTLDLYVANDANEWRLLTSRAIFGDTQDVSSIRSLAPGEIAQLRTSGDWLLAAPTLAEFLGPASGRARIRAVYNLHSGQSLLSAPASNVVELNLSLQY